MHDNLIIAVAVLTAFVLSITLVLYVLRLMDRDRQWRPRRYGLSAREMPCSFCGKVVRAEAVICRYCHHRLDEVIEADDSGEPIVSEGVLAPAQAAMSARGRLATSIAAAAMPSGLIADEDLSKNKTFVWLDTAFEQITEREPVAEWGPASLHPEEHTHTETDASATQTVGIVPMVRAIGLLSTIPLAEARDWRGWFTRDWFATRKREWGIAAAIATIAFIVGGSTFLAGPSNPGGEKKDDYVAFDVSERAPLVAVPELKPGERQPEERPVAAAPKASVSGAVSVPPQAMVAAPEFTAPPQPEAAVPPDNVVMAAPTAVPVKAGGEEDWASTVSRAVNPTYSRDLVVAVQRLIRADGFDPGPIDGLVGPRTRRAILAYQHNGGLPPTGEIDRALLVNLQLAGRTVRVIGPMSGVATAGRKKAK